MENFNSYCIEKRALLNNIQKIKSFIGKTKFCAVVKANAYGLGVENVCPIIDSMVDFYAVICVKEALNLRKLTNKDILILGASDLNRINDCAKNNITIAISTLEEVDAINRTAKLPINVHLKINSGMNRFGIKKKCELKRILEAIKKGNKINITGVYTHFATKDADTPFIEKQYKTC